MIHENILVLHFMFVLLCFKMQGCCFFYHLDMVRPTDQEMITTGKIVCYSHCYREGGTPGHTGLHRKTASLIRKQQ